MTEHMELLNAFDPDQFDHVLSDGLGFIPGVWLVTVGKPSQVRCNEREVLSQLLNDREKLSVVLWPTMHTQHRWPVAYDHVVQVDTINAGTFFDKTLHVETPGLSHEIQGGTCAGSFLDLQNICGLVRSPFNGANRVRQPTIQREGFFAKTSNAQAAVDHVARKRDARKQKSRRLRPPHGSWTKRPVPDIYKRRARLIKTHPK
jgi:hypothetical protein